MKVNDDIDLAPASPELAQLDVLLTGKLDPQFILEDNMKDLMGIYDYVVIDKLPSLNMAVLNALTASQSVVVPTQADIYSLKGLKDLASTVNSIKRRSNPELKIDGILISRYNSRTVFTSHNFSIGRVALELHTTVFESKIREAIAVKEAQNNFQSIFEYEPRGKVTEDIEAFINEFLTKEK